MMKFSGMITYSTRSFLLLALALAPTSLWAQAAGQGQAKDVDPYLRNEVKNTIVKNAKDLQPCYLDYLAAKPERTEGRIKLDWQITTKGQVVKPDLVASEFNHASFEKCLLDKIAKLEFPPHDRKVNFYVAHEFFFKDEQSQAEASSNKTKKP